MLLIDIMNKVFVPCSPDNYISDRDSLTDNASMQEVVLQEQNQKLYKTF